MADNSPARIPKTPDIAKINGRPSKSSLERAQRTLHDNQLRYAVWLSFPSEMRKPSTKEQFAKLINVALPTLYRWDKDPNLIMAVRWLAIQNAGDVGRISNVVTFLYETTMDDSLGHRVRLDAARDFLKAIGVHEVNKFDNKLLKLEDAMELDLDSMGDEELWELYNERAREAGLSGGWEPLVDDPDEITEGEIVE